jgi:EAL domain-containing protein (putative c-di-GMP-specific phosphodiesterase class I)
MAEEPGLAPILDLLILGKVLPHLSDGGPTTLAMNLSIRTLEDADALGQAAEIIKANPEARARLHLEVTETALANISAKSVAAMEGIHALGVPWHVDDFGTGSSSISMLKDLPISGLKLDRSFTAGIAAEDERSTQVAQGLAGLAHGLGITTIAEGVEDAPTARLLAAQGWEYGQGFHYGKARPAVSA